MVLDHIAHGAGFFVVLTSGIDADILRDRDLDIVHVAAVPDRLEDAVAEAEHHDVLDGLLAEVVINAIDLVFSKGLIELAI